MFAAARWGDLLTHDAVTPAGVIGPPVSGPAPGGMVIIERQPAAYMTCSAACTGVVAGGIVHPPPPGPPPPIIKGSMTVLINLFPAARWMPSGDTGGCGVFLGFPPLMPFRTVFIGGASGSVLDMMAGAVNPAGGSINCGKIIDAVIDRLDGSDPDATAPTGRNGSFSDIEKRHGTTLSWGSSFEDAFDAVRDGGHGTTAIVGIGYSSGGSHVVVMTNNHGEVGIVEGQDWGSGNPPEVIRDPDRANQRYNSDGGSNVGYGIIP